MFVNEKIVFVELHKTGCTHIGKWLDRLVGGQQIGKHNRAPEEFRSRFMVGSVRNPWDWYVSLWAYGCSGRGAVYHNTTRNLDLSYLSSQLGPEMGRGRPGALHAVRQAMADLSRDSSRWRDVYRDHRDVGAFREWLRMMMDRKHRFDVAEGYGFSPCSNWSGLMTYRYLKLFSSLDDDLYKGNLVSTKTDADFAWRKYKLPSFFIRLEALEDDLLEALSLAGYEISEEQREALLNAADKKTNTSSRMATPEYFDDESARLISDRESLVIAEHGYASP